MKRILLALLFTGCASQAQSTQATTPSKLPISAVADANMDTAYEGPLRGKVARVDKIASAPDGATQTVTVSLENTGASECMVSHYKLEIPLGAVATSKASCAVHDVRIAPGSKSDVECRVGGTTQLGIAPGLAVGTTPVVDIVATCK